MGQTSGKTPPADHGDRFILDFGKNAFRFDEKVGKEEQLQQKLPPEPGPIPNAQTVAPAQVLNRRQLGKKK
jgi:hypothetical protein